MKKLFLVGALALFAAVNAQQTKFGVKAGYVMSTLSTKAGSEKISSDAKSSFYVGGLVEHKLTTKFALQGEILYADLGGKTKESENGYSYESKTNLGTLLIPVSAKYFVADQFALSAGVNFGFIMSAKDKWTETYEGDTESGEEDVKKHISSLNLAPFVGLEYSLPQGLFFDARYNFGLSNLEKDAPKDYSTKNSFFQIGVGYKF